MTAISTTTPTTPTTPATPAPKTADPMAQMLGKDDFLKLLVSQLSHQDPMNPVDDKDFMGQMAQFTSVEQLTNMAASIDRMSSASQTTQSVALLGRTVSWKKDGDSTGEGVASSVDFGTDGAITIHVGDETVAPGEIVSVK